MRGERKRKDGGSEEAEAHVRTYRRAFRKSLRAALQKETGLDTLTLLRVGRALNAAEREALEIYRDSRAPVLDTIEQGAGDAGR
jgi:hypothetical protein